MYHNLNIKKLQEDFEHEYRRDFYLVEGPNPFYGIQSLGWAGYEYYIKKEDYVNHRFRSFFKDFFETSGLKNDILTSEITKKINTRNFISEISDELAEITLSPSRLEWFLDIHERSKYLKIKQD